MSESLVVSELFSAIQGEGLFAGRRQIFIRLTGCNLECSYCDTDFAATLTGRVETRPGCGEFTLVSQPFSLDRMVEIVSRWITELPKAHHSISITGGEPLLHSDILVDWLPKLRTLLPVHLETNGTLYAEMMQLLPHLDHICMDLKIPSTSGCDQSVLEQHQWFLCNVPPDKVSVKIVVDEDTSREEIQMACAQIAAVDPMIPLFIQPRTRMDGTIAVTAAWLLTLQQEAAAQGADVKVIPQLHKMLGCL